MEKNQFDLLMLAITGLKTELKADISSLKSDMNARFEAVDVRLDRIETDLGIIKQQVGETFEKVADHEARIRKIEGPSA